MHAVDGRTFHGSRASGGVFSADLVHRLSTAHFSTAGSARFLRNAGEKVAENANVNTIENPAEILCNLLRKNGWNPVDGMCTACAQLCGNPAQKRRISGGIHDPCRICNLLANYCKCEYLPSMLCSFYRRPLDVVVVPLTWLFSRRSLFATNQVCEWGRGSDEEIRAVVSPFRAKSAPVGVPPDSRLPGHLEGQITGSPASGTRRSPLPIEIKIHTFRGTLRGRCAGRN